MAKLASTIGSQRVAFVLLVEVERDARLRGALVPLAIPLKTCWRTVGVVDVVGVGILVPVRVPRAGTKKGCCVALRLRHVSVAIATRKNIRLRDRALRTLLDSAPIDQQKLVRNLP